MGIEVAKMLQEYGGWGVAAVLFYVILRLIKHIDKKDNHIKERNEYIDRLHKEQRDDNKETVEALVTTRNTIRSFKDVFMMFMNKIQNPPSTSAPSSPTSDNSSQKV
jgi:hypothetical protein